MSAGETGDERPKLREGKAHSGSVPPARGLHLSEFRARGSVPDVLDTGVCFGRTVTSVAQELEAKMRHMRIAVLLGLGCSDPAAPACQPGFGIETAFGCAGVSQATLCSGRFCVPDDATCGRTVYIEAGGSGDGSEKSPFGDLPEAAAGATPGTCLVVGEGSHTGASIPGGVSILGAGASRTEIAGLAVEGGEGGPRWPAGSRASWRRVFAAWSSTRWRSSSPARPA